MSTLIDQVKYSRRRITIGESVRVHVSPADANADITINGIYGARQFVQFRSPGTYNIVVSAMLGDQVEQVAERVVVTDAKAGALPIPIIWATQDRYRPRLVVFSVPGADQDRSMITEYEWAFGDGTVGISQSGTIDHDYTDALARDALYTPSMSMSSRTSPTRARPGPAQHLRVQHLRPQQDGAAAS